MAYQEEDWHRRNQAHIITRKPLENPGVYETRVTIGLGVKDARNVGPSANWYQMASGIAAFANFDKGKRSMELVLSEPNDFLQGEFMADPAHYIFNLEGMMFQRKYYIAHNYMELAAKIDANVLQWWANIVLATTLMKVPGRAAFAYAHQRTVAPAGGATLIDYYWRRGQGQSHTATGLSTLGDHTARNQAPFTGHLFADFFVNDLRSDVGRVLGLYKAGGYEAVAGLIKRGSRGTFHWVRLNTGGYISLVEADFGIDEPRYVAMRQGEGTTLLQFPAGQVGRFAREGAARIDMKYGDIAAKDSMYGSFSSKFDPKNVTLHVIANPAGVTIQRFNPPVTAPPATTSDANSGGK